MTHNFKIIAEAGLTQTEFANLLGAQRVTINNWVRGRSFPHKIWGSKITSLLTLLQLAIRAAELPGEIPPVHSNNMTARGMFIRAALREVAAEAKIKKAARKYETDQL